MMDGRLEWGLNLDSHETGGVPGKACGDVGLAACLDGMMLV